MGRGGSHGYREPRRGQVPVMIVATGLLGHHAYYLHWGVVQISITNFVIIVLMIVVFVLALVLPFPGGRADESGQQADQEQLDVQR